VALALGSEVDLSERDGTIVISPVMQKVVSLRQLLSKVTKENTHGEISTGKVKGGEAS
jgi:antitoxin component of MazEF toxin-antitoxin module